MFYFEILEELYKSKIRYLIVGGLAVNLHNVPRMTNDIDLILAMDDSNLRAFTQLMQKLGYIPRIPVNPELLMDKNTVRSWITQKNMIAFSFINKNENYKIVDVLISHPLDFEAAYQRRDTRKIMNFEIHTIALEDLISMKRHSGREMDLHDIELLLAADNLLRAETGKKNDADT